MTLHVTYLGGGKFEAANAYDRQQALARFGQGEELFCELKKPRSSKQNRAFFAALNKSWENQRGDNWDNPEHLRAGSYCHVGHCDTATYLLPPGTDVTDIELLRLESFVSQVVTQFHIKGGYAFIRRVGDRGIAVDTPESWSFNVTDHDVATWVFDACLDYWVNDVCPGITREQLLKAAEEDPK